MNSTDSMQHRAAQYLAMFGKNFLSKKEDDSHTNLGWDPEKQAYVSRSTEDGQYLILHTEDLRLEWLAHRNYELSLVGRTHGEILTWLHHIALKCGHEEYEFELHYELTSGLILPLQQYDQVDSKRAKVIGQLRSHASAACERLKEKFGLDSEIRVWPHHFDTGGFSALPNGSEVNMGFGMAVPDTMIDDYYYYVAGYRGQDGIVTSKFNSLESGKWMDDSFNGAVLEASTCSEEQLDRFFESATKKYLEL